MLQRQGGFRNVAKQLPPAVKAKVAGRMLSKKEDYESAMKDADDVHLTLGGSATAVAAVEENVDVDAATRGKPFRGCGRGNRRFRGNHRGYRGRGAQSHPPAAGATSRGERHPDGPPESACNQHYRWGRGAFFCSQRDSCPWRDEKEYCAPPQDRRA